MIVTDGRYRRIFSFGEYERDIDTVRILLYGINFSPELTGIGKYSGELAHWLVDSGHDLQVITAPPYYPEWRVHAGFMGGRYTVFRDGNLVIRRCPIYVPRKLSALTRILHLLSFALSSFPVLFRHWSWRPDVILLVVPTLFCAPQAASFARLSGALSVIHIQDFEVDALFGLEMAQGGLFQCMSSRIERFILRRFDSVSTISSGMLRRAQDKGVSENRLRYFPNWAEVEKFRGVERSSVLLKQLNVEPSKRIVLYSGNIGEKQGLEILVDCARLFQDREDVVFLIVGSGAGKARLQSLVRSCGLTNVVFSPLQPVDDLPQLLASADCHLVVQRRGAADAVMPSKLTNILAVGGNAVITADPETTLGELCRDFPGIATLVAPESVDDLVRGIKIAIDLPRPNLVAQNYAEEHLSKDRILRRFFDEIEADVAARKSRFKK